MCWKKSDLLYGPMNPALLRFMSYSINDYPGSVNDLKGCINDAKQGKNTLIGFWPYADTRLYLDSQATLRAFRTETPAAIASLSPGATILVMADSCFSQSVTRKIRARGVEEVHIPRNRFYATPGVEVGYKYKSLFTRSDLCWLAMSGCGETQYSADAYINDGYHGAFSWHAFRLLEPGMTYRSWYEAIRKYLPSSKFDQIPSLEGPEYMKDRIVFQEQTLVIHNSTHGTQLKGITPDEDIDEALVLYDGNLRDKEYYSILKKVA